MSGRIQLTLITSRKPAVLSKSFELNTDGKLEKRSGGQLIEGWAQRQTLSLVEFAKLLGELKPNQALCFGVTNFDGAIIVPQKSVQHSAHESRLPVCARTRKNFTWPEGGGIMMLDYDPRQGFPPMAREELLEALYTVWPALGNYPHVWTPSASSCIHRSDTDQELRGIEGQRIYIPVADASDIPRAGANLVMRLWLNGFGRFDVSKSGALLQRTIVDASVWQPERLDFAGGAACGPGIEQRRPNPIIFNE